MNLAGRWLGVGGVCCGLSPNVQGAPERKKGSVRAGVEEQELARGFSSDKSEK